MSEQSPNYPRAKSVPPVKHIISLPYVHRPFPAARYHPDGRSILVHSQEEADGLSQQWSATPLPPAAAPPPIEVPKCSGCAERDATLAGFTAEAVEANDAYAADLAKRDEIIADLQEQLAKARKRK